MSEVTAEMIARGRFTDARSLERRRLADRVREAREQADVGSGAGKLVFDLELLRLYAEGRKAAIVPQVLLCFAIAAMTTLWLPPISSRSGWFVLLSAVGMAWLPGDPLPRSRKGGTIRGAELAGALRLRRGSNGLSWACFRC